MRSPRENEAGRLRLALAEIALGQSLWCREYWYPGVPEGELRRRLLALEAAEEAGALRLRVAAPPEPAGGSRRRPWKR